MMKKIKLIYLPLLAICLVGCSNNDHSGGKGVIDCYSIRVTNGGSTVFSETYYAGYATVYEYKSAEGKTIYTGLGNADTSVYVYADRYTNTAVTYNYSRFVGYLTVENNYYLNLDSRTIDEEIKWSEYKYESNPTTNYPDGTTPNNKEAYSCAKKGYYNAAGGLYSTTNIRLDMNESSLERHTYIKLGDDSIITYVAKWF